MKKRIIGLTALAAVITLSACNGGKKEISPSRLKAKGEQLVDKTVKVTGKVLRVSYPVGKRLTLVDTSDNTTLLFVKAGGDVELFSPKLMGQVITLTGDVKVHKISKEDVARMDSVLAASDSIFARLDSLRGRFENDSLSPMPPMPPMPPRHGMRHHGPEGEQGPDMKKECRGEFMRRPIPPFKAKFMKEKQTEIKNWFSENSDKEYYPDLYIEIKKLSPASKLLNKFTPEDSVRLQRHHAFDKKHKHHGREGHFGPEHRHHHPHAPHAPHGQRPEQNQTEQNN
ncbi:MAG: hypothetical protein II623_02615 [Paludibacteraceae bacterium]|nr:hypothetical protein [Paludibacteraceae bacterium]